MLESQVSGVSEYQCVTDTDLAMPAKNCCTITSIRNGNFFDSAHLPLRTLIDMIYYRSIELPHATIQYELGVDDKTLCDYTLRRTDV